MLAALALLACASAAAAAAGTPELGHFLDKARGIEDWLVSTRRLLHTIPELFYEVCGSVGAADGACSWALLHWSGFASRVPNRSLIAAVLLPQEHNTSATIRRYLDELGIPYQ